MSDSSTTNAPRKRTRMSSADRREMLVAITLELLNSHGPNVTTQRIAEVAEIAEGTIFRSFPDKETLVRQAIAKGFDTGPTMAGLDAVDMSLPVRERLIAVTELLQQYFVRIFGLMLAVGRRQMADRDRDDVPDGQYAVVAERIVEILRPDEDAFRHPLAEVIRILRLLTFAGSHPVLTEGRLLTAEEIADVVLDGMRRPTDQLVERG